MAVSLGTSMRLTRRFEAIASMLVDSRPETGVRMAAPEEQLRAILDAVPLPSEQVRLGRHQQAEDARSTPMRRRAWLTCASAAGGETQRAPTQTASEPRREMGRLIYRAGSGSAFAELKACTPA